MTQGFEATLRAQFEPLQYAAFFGALLLLGLLETVMAVKAEPAVRRTRWPANFGLTAINLMVLGALFALAMAGRRLPFCVTWPATFQPAIRYSAAKVTS